MISCAVTSGKGGVGKTTIVANLACLLGRMGKRVLVLDADLGLGNLDVLFGLRPSYTLEHVLTGQRRLKEIVLKGPAGVEVIPAPSGVEEVSSLSRDQRLMLLEQFEEVLEGVDVLLIDTAPGISSNVVFFNLAASEVLVVVCPEPCSMVDSYALMKVLALNHSKRDFRVLVNNARDALEGKRVFERLDELASRFLGATLDWMGLIPNDPKVLMASKQRRLFVEAYPESKASVALEGVARRVLKLPRAGAGSPGVLFG